MTPNKSNHSLPASYFDAIYQENIDPWDFEHSAYERQKYAATLQALPQQQYANAFEIGCSIGILTEALAPRCRQLLSVDGSVLPLEKAKQRLQAHPQVRLEQMLVPANLPPDSFDLVLISEVGYYWSWEDLDKMQRWLLKSLLPGGTLLLVHWTPYVADYPLTGDEVHNAFMAFAREQQVLTHMQHQREEKYRLDVFTRIA